MWGVLLEATPAAPRRGETQEGVDILGACIGPQTPAGSVLIAHILCPSPPQPPVPGAHGAPQLPPGPGGLCGHLHAEPQPDDLWPRAHRECPLAVGWGCMPAPPRLLSLPYIQKLGAAEPKGSLQCWSRAKFLARG